MPFSGSLSIFHCRCQMMFSLSMHFFISPHFCSWQKNIYCSSVPLALRMFVQYMDYGILKTFVIVWQVPSLLGRTALPQRVQHPEGTSQPSTEASACLHQDLGVKSINHIFSLGLFNAFFLFSR